MCKITKCHSCDEIAIYDITLEIKNALNNGTEKAVWHLCKKHICEFKTESTFLFNLRDVGVHSFQWLKTGCNTEASMASKEHHELSSPTNEARDNWPFSYPVA